MSENAPCVLVLRIQLGVDSTVEVAHLNALLEDVHRHLEMIALRLLASPHHLQYSGGALQVTSRGQGKSGLVRVRYEKLGNKICWLTKTTWLFINKMLYMGKFLIKDIVHKKPAFKSGRN